MGTLSAHFNRAEFACECGCGYDTVDAVLVDMLERIRAHFDAPVVINSGCRCTMHNRAIGGEPASLHMQGRAADIAIRGVIPSVVADYAETLNPGGLGRYTSFTHIDSRNGRARWRG